jgi:hypothetical protein
VQNRQKAGWRGRISNFLMKDLLEINDFLIGLKLFLRTAMNTAAYFQKQAVGMIVKILLSKAIYGYKS